MGDPVLWALDSINRKAIGLMLGDFSGSDAFSDLVKQVFETDAVGIVSVNATRGPTSADILVLKNEGSIVIWAGHQEYYPCRIRDGDGGETGRKRENDAADDGMDEREGGSSSPPAKVLRTLNRGTRVVGMSGSVGDLVSFTMSNGRTVRSIVKFEPLDCVTRACLEALRRYLISLMSLVFFLLMSMKSLAFGTLRMNSARDRVENG